jgi:hypothetical protein
VSHSSDPHVAAIMLKDVHLVEATLATHDRIASLDENARGHFGRLATKLQALRRLLWINPTRAEEDAISWLEKGAPIKKSLRLKPSRQ